MAVTAEYRDFVLEQLARVAPAVTHRRMFGGVGIYSDGLFFAVLDDDTIFLKVDDSNRGDFEAAGMGPFAPFEDGRMIIRYYELPADLLEDADALRPWVLKAIDVARAARRRKKR
ncbi:TfoX/Sxy family protein [Longimicrobium sp.]|uniref:TfoX/Sxy family protein n=1 Tax=Longimicrobium sp. TaxID=2029185 RepID=UPI002C675402|nr:TfoX/Sxy family protein [Longimicrobium sp.]HSU16004.1 TfoX/Sxy family protein [Longimicrobium sp.]